MIDKIEGINAFFKIGNSPSLKKKAIQTVKIHNDESTAREIINFISLGRSNKNNLNL